MQWRSDQQPQMRPADLLTPQHSTTYTNSMAKNKLCVVSLHYIKISGPCQHLVQQWLPQP